MIKHEKKNSRETSLLDLRGNCHAGRNQWQKNTDRKKTRDRKRRGRSGAASLKESNSFTPKKSNQKRRERGKGNLGRGQRTVKERREHLSPETVRWSEQKSSKKDYHEGGFKRTWGRNRGKAEEGSEQENHEKENRKKNFRGHREISTGKRAKK